MTPRTPEHLPSALTALLRVLAAARLDRPELQPVLCPRGPRLALRQCAGRWRDIDPRCAGCPDGRDRSWRLAELTGEITPLTPPSGTLTCDELLRRAGFDPEETSMKDHDETTTTTEGEGETPDTAPAPHPLDLCPCGCGREVAPNRTYASKGCAGRMRWRGVGRSKEREQETEPVASEEIPTLPPWADYGAPIPIIADACPRCHETKTRPGDGSTRHPRWSCVSCGYEHNIPMGPQGGEWMPVTVQQQLATVREETARRYEQEAAELTQRLEAAEGARDKAETESAGQLASILNETVQRRTVAEALGLPQTAGIDEVLAEIRRLQEHQEAPPSPSEVARHIGLLSQPRSLEIPTPDLPSPEALPAATLFRYAEYALKKTEELSALADRLSGAVP